MSDEKGTRINKYLSEIGFCSRRKADLLIEQERIKVNGIYAVMGQKVMTFTAKATVLEHSRGGDRRPADMVTAATARTSLHECRGKDNGS